MGVFLVIIHFCLGFSRKKEHPAIGVPPFMETHSEGREFNPSKARYISRKSPFLGIGENIGDISTRIPPYPYYFGASCCIDYVFLMLIFPGPEEREVFQDWTEGVPLAGDLCGVWNKHQRDTTERPENTIGLFLWMNCFQMFESFAWMIVFPILCFSSWLWNHKVRSKAPKTAGILPRNCSNKTIKHEDMTRFSPQISPVTMTGNCSAMPGWTSSSMCWTLVIHGQELGDFFPEIEGESDHRTIIFRGNGIWFRLQFT